MRPRIRIIPDAHDDGGCLGYADGCVLRLRVYADVNASDFLQPPDAHEDGARPYDDDYARVQSQNGCGSEHALRQTIERRQES